MATEPNEPGPQDHRRPGSQRPGGRTARVRAAVLTATLDELAEVGYDDLSIDAVAGRAGVHKTTVYRRWPTKPDLVLDATRQRGAQLVPVPDTGSFPRDLEALAQAVAASLATPADQRMSRNLIAASNASPTPDDHSVTFWAERMRLNGQIVERAIARGELPQNIDPNLVIEALLGPLFMRLLMTGEPITADVASDIARLVAAGAPALAETDT
jgi:AcrR family transcriptional regulator